MHCFTVQEVVSDTQGELTLVLTHQLSIIIIPNNEALVSIIITFIIVDKHYI